MQQYCLAEKLYRQRVKEDKEKFGGIWSSQIPPPIPPFHLQLWMELKRWPGHLLCEGGLYDQPDWTWQLIDLAGMVYEGSMSG